MKSAQTDARVASLRPNLATDTLELVARRASPDGTVNASDNGSRYTFGRSYAHCAPSAYSDAWAALGSASTILE